MSDTNETPENSGANSMLQQDAQSDSNDNNDFGNNNSDGKKSNTPLIIAVVALLVALGALGFAYWLYDTRAAASSGLQQQEQNYQQLKQQVQDQIQQQIQQAESSMHTAQEQLSEVVQNKIDTADAALNKHFTSQQQMIKANAEKLATVMNLNSQQQRSWVLAEVDYLVRMAALNINIMNDNNQALNLLHTAQKQIADLADPVFEPIAKLLEQDQQNVQQSMQVDQIQLVQQLDSLSNQVEALPLIPQRMQNKQPQTKAPEKTGNKLKDHWNMTVHNLRGLFVIRHLDQPVQPLLPPEQLMYLRENISMKLFQAQWALLHRQQNLYVASLQQAQEWLQKYFGQNTTAMTQISTEMKKLEQVNVAPELPNLSDTLLALDEMQHSLRNASAQQQGQ